MKKKGRGQLGWQSTKIDLAKFGQISVGANLAEILSGLTRPNSIKFWLGLTRDVNRAGRVRVVAPPYPTR